MADHCYGSRQSTAFFRARTTPHNNMHCALQAKPMIQQELDFVVKGDKLVRLVRLPKCEMDGSRLPMQNAHQASHDMRARARRPTT